jgi:hypothetical protein
MRRPAVIGTAYRIAVRRTPFARTTATASATAGRARAAAERFRETAGAVFDRIMQMTDNAGATDEHRALNYLTVRYPAAEASLEGTGGYYRGVRGFTRAYQSKVLPQQIGGIGNTAGASVFG